MELTRIDLEIRRKGFPDSLDSIFLKLYDIKKTDAFILKGVENISGGEQSIIFGDTYGTETAVQNIAANPREIILKIGFNPQYSYGQTLSSLRDYLHTFMGPTKNQSVRLTAMGLNNESMRIDGYISKIEADTFSASTDVFVTIKCAIPFFKKVVPVITEFPWIEPNETIFTAPRGSAFTTFELTIEPGQASVNLMTISTDANVESLKLKKDNGLFDSPSNDQLYINTDISAPEVARFKGSYDTGSNRENLVNYLSYDSQFFVLPPRNVYFSINLPARYQVIGLTFNEYYWGV